MLGRADTHTSLKQGTTMSRFLTGLGTAVLVAGATWFFTGAAPTDAQEKAKGVAAPRVTWEYKMMAVYPPTEEEFNKFGADGWELVTSFQVVGKSAPHHVFKRPRSIP